MDLGDPPNQVRTDTGRGTCVVLAEKADSRSRQCNLPEIQTEFYVSVRISEKKQYSQLSFVALRECVMQRRVAVAVGGRNVERNSIGVCKAFFS